MNLLAAAAVLLVIRQALGRRKPAPAARTASSPLLPCLAAAAAVAGVTWWNATRPGPKVIVVPAPASQPAVTVTAPPKAVPAHFALHLTFLDHLSGTDWTVIAVAALVLTYAAVRPLLHRSAS